MIAGMKAFSTFYKADKEWEDELFNLQQTWLMWYSTFSAIAMSRFLYDCEDDIPKKDLALDFIESCLFYNGGVIATIEGEAFTFAGFSMEGNLNIYGYPENFIPIYANGINGTLKDVDEVVWLCEFPYSPQIINWKADYYASVITLCDLTTLQNLNAQKHPFVITGTTQNKLSLITAMDKIKNFCNALFLKDNGGIGSKITALDLKVPLIMENVQQQKRQYINEYLTFLGVLNNTHEKAERMITSEKDNDNAITNTLRLKALHERNKFCERVNDKFGIGLSVKWNGDGIVSLNELYDMAERSSNEFIHNNSTGDFSRNDRAKSNSNE